MPYIVDKSISSVARLWDNTHFAAIYFGNFPSKRPAAAARNATGNEPPRRRLLWEDISQ